MEQCGIRRQTQWAMLYAELVRIRAGWTALLAARSSSSRGSDTAEENEDQLAERLLTTYETCIFRFAYSYLHNRSDAEEILKDTILRYLEKRPDVTSPGHEKAWLLHVAGNLSKDRIRFNRVRNCDELSDTLAAENREDLSFLWEAVKQLPARYREVIHLFYHEGYSTAEISDILHRNESTVRSDLHRAKAELKTVLKEEFDFE